MPRRFNVAGPCNPEDHYMLPATARLPDVQTLIDQKAYFVLHGARQSGKTTAMIELARQLTAAGRYAAALVSMEVGAAFNDNPGAAELAILEDWRAALVWQLPAALQPPSWPEAEAGGRLGAALAAWCMASPRPVVLFVDEIDALQDAALISALRQLRAGFQRRPDAFPWALALIGLRDVRDYKVASGGSARLQHGQPLQHQDTSR
jgi:type II secretory pathway predicted ATPase ExeA